MKKLLGFIPDDMDWGYVQYVYPIIFLGFIALLVYDSAEDEKKKK